MEEQFLFTHIHEALDIPTPPGAYERLRSELTKKPVRPFRWPALQTRWSKMSFRFATGLAIIAIAVAAAAAAVAIHNSTNNTSPAGSRMSIQAYQKMIADDNANASATYSAPCGSGNDSGCGSDAARGIPAIQKWVGDLSRPDIPTRFLVVNAELREVLIQNIGAQKDLLTASQSNDGPGMDRAFTLAVFAVDWTGTVLPSIAGSKQVDAATYVSRVASARKDLKDCLSTCTMLASSDARRCTTSDGVSCLDLFDNTAPHFVQFGATLVQYAAPGSLSSLDTALQNDVAQANAVLMTMRVAVAANDQAGINSGIDQLIRLEAKIDAGAARVTG